MSFITFSDFVEINDDLLIDVVNKQIKMRKDSITEFEKGGRQDLIETLSNWDKNIPIPDLYDVPMRKLLKDYFIVGGMPEVVDDFVNNKDFNRVSIIQNRILENYRFDISKHAKGAEKIKVRKF